MTTRRRPCLVVTDGAADVLEPISDHSLTIVPINIYVGEDEYLSDETLTRDSFYSLITGPHPTLRTSQPRPHQFMERISLLDPESQVLVISVTSRLSGTFNSAGLASRELADEFDVDVFDSGLFSVGQGVLAARACRLASSGASRDEIVQDLGGYRSSASFFMLNNGTEFGLRSGRVQYSEETLQASGPRFPVLEMTEGVIVERLGASSIESAIDAVVHNVARKSDGSPRMAQIVHAGDASAASAMADSVAALDGVEDVGIGSMSIGGAINVGPGTVGAFLVGALR